VQEIFPDASHRRNVLVQTPKNIAAMPILAGTMMIACNNVPGLFKLAKIPIMSKIVQKKISS